MALDANRLPSPESEARWWLFTPLLRPFAAIGRVASVGIDNLGAAAIFLILALLKIVRPKQISKIVQQIYYIGARSMMIIMLVGLLGRWSSSR